MFRRTLVMAALTVAAFSAVAMAEAPAQILNEAAQTLARLKYTYNNDIVGKQEKSGLALCIDEAKGIFITFDVSNQIPAEELKDFTLTPSGPDAKPVNAEFIGVDPEQGLGFIQAVEKNSFKAAKLDLSAKLDVGQEIYSVGLLGPQTGSTPYLGIAKISALFRLPNRLATVTGGDLCGVSSPVLNAEGKVVGLITPQQMMQEYRLRTPDGQQAEVGLTSSQSARTFSPLSDFAAVLAQVPTKGNMRKMPWIGIFGVKSPTATEADVLGLAGKGVVMVDRMLPGGPAEKAGLKAGDPIIGLNGQPIEKMAIPELTELNFVQKMWQFKPGDKVTFTIFREKASKDIQVTLEAMPPSMIEAKRYYSRTLGLVARDLQMWDRYGTARPAPLETQGALLFAVPQGGLAAKAGLKPGDIVTQLNDKPVANVGDMENLIKAAGKGDLKFQVMRDEKPEIVVIRQ